MNEHECIARVSNPPYSYEQSTEYNGPYYVDADIISPKPKHPTTRLRIWVPEGMVLEHHDFVVIREAGDNWYVAVKLGRKPRSYSWYAKLQREEYCNV